MSDVLINARPEVWRRGPTRLAIAGGPRWRLYESVVAALDTASVERVEHPLLASDGSSVAPEVAQADILITGLARIDDTVVDQMPNLRFVLRPYVGYDDVDVEALTRHGILFANVPDTFIEEVANHTLALILAGNRKLIQADAFVKRGGWAAGSNRDASTPIRRLSNLTLGLVGFGNIARLVVERAKPFGFRMLASDPFVADEVAHAMGVSLVSMDELLAESDIVSLHVFLNATTRHLIDATQLAKMKPSAYLVNTSRGPVIDERALAEALRSGRLAGAGLDVFEVEPVATDSPLLQMSNVIATAHIASYSEEGDQHHFRRTAEIAQQVIDGNLPERKVVVNKDLFDALASHLTVGSV